MASDELTPKFSVGEFVSTLNQTLEYAYPAVEVEGEVASFKVNQQKYVFFDLKDATASVGCFMTIWQLRVPVEDGMKVIVRATPKLTQWGKFSLTVQSIRPSGEGSIKKSFELLKAKLAEEGLFDVERKRALPEHPIHIGVISSTQAAGYADFIKILGDRFGGIKVDVAHVQVQGEGAADQIIRALEYFNSASELPEVVAVIRGGGSADDLSTFNDEKLVRAIASSRVPTIVGVGHEIDETLADLAADVRAATPSNAAQILVPDRREIAERVTGLRRSALMRVYAHIDRAIESMATRRQRMLDTFGGRLDEVEGRLRSSYGRLEAYNPRKVLERGYAIVRGEVKPGEVIEIERHDETIIAEVKDVTSK